MLGKIFEFLKTLVMLAVFGSIGWYGYSVWQDSSSTEDGTVRGASFNCRVALADLAKGYTCRDSSACQMTDYELERLKRLEIDIGIYCN